MAQASFLPDGYLVILCYACEIEFKRHSGSNVFLYTHYGDRLSYQYAIHRKIVQLHIPVECSAFRFDHITRFRFFCTTLKRLSFIMGYIYQCFFLESL